MLHMMYKFSEFAGKTWRRQKGFDYLAKVITRIKFRDGIEVLIVDQNVA